MVAVILAYAILGHELQVLYPPPAGNPFMTSPWPVEAGFRAVSSFRESLRMHLFTSEHWAAL